MYRFLLLFVSLIFANPGFTQNQAPFWKKVKDPAAQIGVIRNFIPDQYQVLALELESLRQLLATAPPSDSPDPALLIELPGPDGEAQWFRIAESAVMAPGLARDFPGIKTYSGTGIDDPYARIRLDLTLFGFHAMVMTPSGDWFIDPYFRKRSAYHQVYSRKNYNQVQDFICELEDAISATSTPSLGPNPIGDELRKYRLAVAATGEYTQFFGGTVEGALAAIVTTVNRVVGLYERDLSVTMQLVDNNHHLIFLDGSTDPYSGNSGTKMSQNQDVVDDSIGTDNYDIGHVFDLGSGGIASLQAVCSSNRKAQGYTGRPQPVGDPFDIDYVAHEMGHQFGANHTFNNCGNQGPRPYEPGSGTTIMAYAGLCGSNNVAPNSDAHFHVASLDEAISFSTQGNGNSCPEVIPSGNTPPLVDAGAGGWVIPFSTPFELVGSATDVEDTLLTYCWEQFDVGPLTPVNSPEGNTPLFRSFPPTANPTRVFPRLPNLVNNSSLVGEILPFYQRNLTFRLTVRDNNPAGGGVDYDEISMSVSGSAGPFQVLSQNEPVTWTSGTFQVVEWAVANTDQAPVNATNVNIYLSNDGGYTYPILLQENTPNDGSEVVFIPEELSGETFRVKVKGQGNVFFDINNQNITIEAPVAPGFLVTPSQVFQAICAPDSAIFQLNIAALLGFTDTIHLSTSNLPEGLSVLFDQNPIVPPLMTNLTISGTENLDSEIVTIEVEAQSGDTTQRIELALEVFSGPPASIQLLSPLDGEENISVTPTFSWEEVAEATTYTLEIAADPDFAEIISIYEGLENPELTATTQLVDSTTFFWRVRGVNPICGEGENSDVQVFTTEGIRCFSYIPDILPVPFDNLPFLLSRIQVGDDFPIRDINVKNVKGSYFPSGSLVFRLSAPNSSFITLIPNLCNQGTSFDISLDDEAVSGNIPCPYQNGGTYQPLDPLRSLIDSPSKGQWRLTLFNNDDAGQLTGWELELCTTATPVAVRAPIAGLGDLRGYPNPVNDLFSLELNLEKAQELHLTIVNTAGQIIRKRALGWMAAGDHNLIIPVGNLPVGMYYYLLKTRDGNGQAAGKFVKQ